MSGWTVKDAAHEAGHACMAWLVGRRVIAVSPDGLLGGPCSVDKAPIEPLNGHRRPLAGWHAASDEILVALAGALGEALIDAPDEPALSRTPQRVPEREPLHVPEPRPVMFQQTDDGEPPEWPEAPESDADQVNRLLRTICESEQEAEAFRVAYGLRADSIARSAHFRALHSHLTAALVRDGGELGAATLKCERERADLRFAMQTIPGDDDGPEAAA